jgi:hypothetical protein
MNLVDTLFRFEYLIAILNLDMRTLPAYSPIHIEPIWHRG